jgi:putative glycosyltransferase (TIGR04348 family)
MPRSRLTLPRVCIVSPALAAANNGNWHTARRWQRFLAPLARVTVCDAWRGEPADALVALHARKSSASVASFHDACAGRPLALVLTGTDLYRDLDPHRPPHAGAVQAIECASHLVVLQDEALHRLCGRARDKARVVVQSATALVRGDAARGSFDFVAVGHLRDEKDPLTLMRAARRLTTRTAPAQAHALPLPLPLPLRIVHIGGALDEALAREAQATMDACPCYRWLGALPHAAARRWIARARALVHMSRMEGGANVVIEAVRSGVPVLASRIDGNVGLLGRDYGGYFEAGDDEALAAAMRRFAADPAYASRLAAQCAALAPRFAPAEEAARVRALLADMLGSALPQ